MSKIEVNTIEPQCGTTLTLGASGDTVALASGASQSGFGRSGSVDWQTTPKTTTFTAVNGEGYFINSGSAITANLPAGSAGAIVAFSDYARIFATYNLTITPNGSEKIGGNASSAKLDVNGQAATFVYVDSTKGWVNVQNAEDTEEGATFITATGGTITTCGNFKIHTFTGPGTFCVSAVGNPAGSTTVDYLVAAGGGGGASQHSGGGGAGGLRFSASTFTAPPTSAPFAGSALPVSATAFPIVVGGGGAARPGVSSPSGSCSQGNSGNNSIFSTITSTAGGGGGGYGSAPRWLGLAGGSGGGGGSQCGTGGAGNTPPTTPNQGNTGGDGGPSIFTGGGGGGASGANNKTGATGGSGIVIIRYRYQ